MDYKILSLTVLLSAIAGCAPDKPKTVKKLNVLFIAIDDLRPELGCYGKKQVISPNIDKLADQSIVFDRAYAQVPVCMPSRISVLTGMHPLSKSFDVQSKWAEIAFPDLPTLPEYFKENGYYTISNGKIFHNQKDSDGRSWSETAWRPKKTKPAFLDPESEQYQRYSSYQYFDKKSQTDKKVEGYRGPVFESPDVPDNAYPDGKILERSIADLERLSKKDQPFFLAVGFIKPHLPFYAPKKYWDLYDRNSIDQATNPYRPENAPKNLKASNEAKNLYHHRGLAYNEEEFDKAAKHGYYACISYIDKLVGDLLNKLEELNLDKNTIVVLWGDHGFHLGEHDMWGKHNTLQNALSVPLIFKVPDMKAGRDYRLAGLINIYPTLCELTGLKQPKHLQPESLLGKKGRSKNTESVFMAWHGAEVVKTDQYMYTEWSQKDGSTKSMLFDHQKDPDENINVADQPDYREVIEELNTMLQKKKEALDAE